MSGADSRWVILLAGGEGSRLRGRCVCGVTFDRPKQFCQVAGEHTLLEMAIERARRITDESRILLLVCDSHRAWWEPELKHLPASNVLSQPAHRGNGIAIFHALFQILRQDKNPIVAVLPSDHAADDEEALGRAIHRAADAARRWSGPVVLLGMTPERAEPDYGWIVPGPASPDLTRGVEEFVEKPPTHEARKLMERGGLWNSFIFTSTAIGLLRLFDEARPDLLEKYPESLLHPGRDVAALNRYYARLPEIDLGRDVLARAAHRLRVLPVEACGWTDLGTPARVEEWLDRRASRARIMALRSEAAPYAEAPRPGE